MYCVCAADGQATVDVHRGMCVLCVCAADGQATVDVLRGMCVLCLCCCAFNMTGTLVTCNNQSRLCGTHLLAQSSNVWFVTF